MGKRGTNLFRQNDGVRALRIAREGGITPSVLEIVAKDGTVYRVYGDKTKVEGNPWDEVLKGDGDHAPKQKRPA
jgi:hypothetical protein